MNDDGSLTPTSGKEAPLSVCERVGVDNVIDDDDDELQLRMFRTYSDPGEQLCVRVHVFVFVNSP